MLDSNSYTADGPAAHCSAALPVFGFPAGIQEATGREMLAPAASLQDTQCAGYVR